MLSQDDHMHTEDKTMQKQLPTRESINFKMLLDAGLRRHDKKQSFSGLLEVCHALSFKAQCTPIEIEHG